MCSCTHVQVAGPSTEAQYSVADKQRYEAYVRQFRAQMALQPEAGVSKIKGATEDNVGCVKEEEEANTTGTVAKRPRTSDSCAQQQEKRVNTGAAVICASRLLKRHCCDMMCLNAIHT
jgi:hypothetical protein